MDDISKNFGNLATFEFFYHNHEAELLTVYANGRNNVKILVRVKIQACQKDEHGNCKMDSDGFRLVDENETVYIDGGDLQKMLYICDYRAGTKIESPWKITFTSNAFTRPIQDIKERPALYSYTQQSSQEYSIAYIYLSCEHAISTESLIFALGIDIPGIGKFDTSDTGTAAVDGVRKFTNPRYLTIKSHAPIDYSLAENIQVTGMPKKYEDFISVAKKLHTRFAPDWIWQGWNHYIGESSRASVTIRPKRESHTFQTRDVSRNRVDMPDTFYPSSYKADLIKAVPGGNYDVTFVFVENPDYGLKQSTIKMVHPNNDIVVWPHVMEYYIKDDQHFWHEPLKDGVITMKICNHRMPHDVMRLLNDIVNDTDTVKVNVEDNYGNSGVVKIETSADFKAIWPQLYVNSKLW